MLLGSIGRTLANGSNKTAVYGKENAGADLDRRFQRAASDNFVDKSVLDSLRRGHEVVAVGVFLDFLDVLAGVMRQNLVQNLAQAKRLTRVNLDIPRLPFEPAGDLMNQYPPIRHRSPPPLAPPPHHQPS